MTGTTRARFVVIDTNSGKVVEGGDNFSSYDEAIYFIADSGRFTDWLAGEVKGGIDYGFDCKPTMVGGKYERNNG